MNNAVKTRKSEKGGAGVKFLAAIAVLFLIAHAAYNYIPVAYDSENFKQEMQTAVVQSVALPGAGMSAADSVKVKLQRAAINNHVPTDALMEVKPVNNIIQAHVRFTKPVSILPFGIYTYNYQFDHTATPTGFLFKEDKTS